MFAKILKAGNPYRHTNGQFTTESIARRNGSGRAKATRSAVIIDNPKKKGGGAKGSGGAVASGKSFGKPLGQRPGRVASGGFHAVLGTR